MPVVVEAASLWALLFSRELNDTLLTAPAVGQAHGQRPPSCGLISAKVNSILSNFRSVWLASQASKKSKVSDSRACVFLKQQEQQQNQNKTREKENNAKKIQGWFQCPTDSAPSALDFMQMPSDCGQTELDTWTLFKKEKEKSNDL